MIALRLKGHVPTPEQIALLEGIGVRIDERGEVKVVGVLVGTDDARYMAMKLAQNGEAEQYARMLPRMPDKKSANLIATGSVVQRTAYLERVMDPKLSLSAYQKAVGNTMQCLCDCSIWRDQ